MKTVLFFKKRPDFRIAFFIVLFFLSYTKICYCQSSFSFSDVQFGGRYVFLDASNTTAPNSFYNSDFYIDFYIHDNVYTKFPNINFSGEIVPIANLWSNAGSFLHLTMHEHSTGLPAVDERANGDPQHNVIGFDESPTVFQGPFNVDSKINNDEALTRRYTNAHTCNDPYLYATIVGADIVLRADCPIDFIPFSSCGNHLNIYDFQSILLHELGHAIGLRHHPLLNPKSFSESQANVMHSSLTKGQCRNVQLFPLDIFAINTLYGTDQANIPCTAFDPTTVDKCLALPYDPVPANVGSYTPTGNITYCCSWCESDKTIDVDWDNEIKGRRARSTITANTMTVTNNSLVELRAQNLITLEAGCLVDGESTLYAEVDGIIECYTPPWCFNAGTSEDCWTQNIFYRMASSDTAINGDVTDPFKTLNENVIFNYSTSPNPALNNLFFRYSLPKKCSVTLRISNILGEVLMTPINNASQDAGEYEKNYNISELTSGIYFCTFTVHSLDFDETNNSFTETKKIIVLEK